jgi:N-acyl-D-aspartate/D-glutamate deacylase
MAYDLKITGGVIIDGSGAPRFAGDVGVLDGRIAALGNAAGPARRTIEADGCVVAPGFVDIHTHYDAQILWDPLLSVSPWHGVTSVVMGNCGFTVAPTRPEHRDLILRTFERVEGMDLAALASGMGSDWGFASFPEYLDRIEQRGIGINVAAFIGHTALRLYVMGKAAVERAASDEEIAAMRRLLVEAMAAGAIGFSTSTSPSHHGFDGKPVPSRLADARERMAMAEALHEVGAGIYYYNGTREPAWDEYAAIARASGRNVCWGVRKWLPPACRSIRRWPAARSSSNTISVFRSLSRPGHSSSRCVRRLRIRRGCASIGTPLTGRHFVTSSPGVAATTATLPAVVSKARRGVAASC